MLPKSNSTSQGMKNKIDDGDDSMVARTPRPSAKGQLYTLVKKQFRVQKKAPGGVLLRMILGPLFLALYGVSFLSSFNDFYEESDVNISGYNYTPVAAFSPLAIFSAEPSGSILLGASQGVDISSLASTMESLNMTLPGEINATGIEDEAQFRASCAAASDAQVTGVFVHAGSPEWRYSVYINGTKRPQSKISGSHRDFWANLQSGFFGLQKMVDASIMSLEGIAFSNQTLTNLPLIQQLPTIDFEGETSWSLLWLPGFYINVGVMFMMNFYITPLIADQRKEVVRQFVLMGVRPFVYWGHWLVVFASELTISAVLYTVLFIVMKFAPLSNGFLIFVNFWLMMLQFAGFITIIPYYVKTETVAGIVPFFGWIISSAAFVPILLLDVPAIVPNIMTVLNPWWASHNFASIYVENDWIGGGKGLTFSNVVDSGMLYCIISQVLGVFFYLALVYYLHIPKKGTFSDKNHDAEQAKVRYESSVSSNVWEPIADDAEVLLQISNLQKSFTSKQGMFQKPTSTSVLRGLDMNVCRGEVFGFLGHNGAGKTTAISILSGELLHDGGVAEYHFREGSFKVGSGSDDKIRSRIGVCPQHDILFDDLTCREHLALFAELKGGIEIKPGQSTQEAILDEVERRLEEVKFTTAGDENNPVKTYSGGMKRKVSIAISLLGDPEIVFMDEPTAGMDPFNRRQVWSMISEAKKGRSIILTTHFMDEADLLSDRIGILNKGKLVAQGSSLFLKHKFGAGYTLTFACSSGQASSVTSMLTSTVANAEQISSIPNRNAGTIEFAWSLPHGTEPLFPKLLESLHDMKCSNVSVDLTTLEQVFLATGTEDHSGDGEDDEEEGEHRVPVANQDVKDIWMEKEARSQRSVGFFKRIRLVGGITALQGRFELESIIFNTIMPVLYLLAGFIAAKALEASNIVTPNAIEISNQAVTETGFTPDVLTIFGLPQPPASMETTGFEFNATLPGPELESYFSEFYLGGIMPNGTLMFNGSLTQSLPVLQGLLSNYTMAMAGRQSSISLELVPLPYQKVEDFPLVPFLLPMFLGIGFMVLAFIVIDVMFYKEYQLYSVFRLMGVSQLEIYLGVAYQTVLYSFLPFFTTAIVLGFALQNPIVGSAGRWLAFILVMLGYCFCVMPFSMMFEPMFSTIQQAKNWFPFIFVAITVLPFVLYTVTFSIIDNKDTAVLIGDLLCLLPPMAFQRGLQGILNLSEEYNDPNLTASEVWGWDARVSYCIGLMFAMGSALWALLLFQNACLSRKRVGGNEKGLDPTDVDVQKERDYAYESDDGVNARDLVKDFLVTPDTDKYKYRFLDLGYWCQRLFCRDPFQKEYTKKHAVKGISFGIKPQELFVLLGPNGSGKTVSTKILIRELMQDGGTVVMGGQPDTTAQSYENLYRQGMVSYCPQFDSLFPLVSVRKHLEYMAMFRGMNLKDVATRAHLRAIEEMLGLDTHAKKMAKSLSGGYKRKLCLAMALVGHPSICFFDEISTGVDPGARHLLWSILKPENLDQDDDLQLPAILLSTHYMDEAQHLATRVGIMINGEMITTGTVGRLREKHCNKNFLEVTFSEGHSPDVYDRLTQFLQDKGLDPIVLESLAGRIKLQFPVDNMSQNTKNLAKLFKLVESVRDELSIEFYSVSLMNLEQIFIELSKRQFNLENGDPSSRAESDLATTLLFGTTEKAN